MTDRRKVSEVAREITGVFEAVTPRAARGLLILVTTIPAAVLIVSTFSTLFPSIITAVQSFTPLLMQLILFFMFFSIVALTAGVVRRLV